MLDAAVLSAIGGHAANANKLLFSISFDPSLPPDRPPVVQDDKKWWLRDFFTRSERGRWLGGNEGSDRYARSCRSKH
jgi:hypothetical protein